LRDGFESANPSRNLWGNQGAAATVAYLGEEGQHDELNGVRQILEEILVRAKEDKHRLVIWYRTLGNLNYQPVHRPSVNDHPNESPTDISKSVS